MGRIDNGLEFANDFPAPACSQRTPDTKIDVVGDRAGRTVHQRRLHNPCVKAARRDNGV